MTEYEKVEVWVNRTVRLISVFVQILIVLVLYGLWITFDFTRPIMQSGPSGPLSL